MLTKVEGMRSSTLLVPGIEVSGLVAQEHKKSGLRV